MSAEKRRSLAANNLRKIIIAIDGPAGAGKKHHCAASGTPFRSPQSWKPAPCIQAPSRSKALRDELPLDRSAPLEQLAAETAILLEPGEAENRVLLDGEDVTGLIRNPLVTDAASRVSTFPAIRAWMVKQQQQLGAAGGVVMEGRDIGTVVFPHAAVKIFLDAAPEVRGQRRYEQLDRQSRPPVAPAAAVRGQTGKNSAVGSDEILRDLRARDERDRNRADSPLRPADDAVLLDSTNMTLDEAVAAAEAIVDSKLGKPKRAS